MIDAQKLVLPISLCATIALSFLYVGRQIGDAERQFKDLKTKVESVDAKFGDLAATTAALATIRADIETLKKSDTESGGKLRQLWFYTHGRIQRMPWHPPQQEE